MALHIVCRSGQSEMLHHVIEAAKKQQIIQVGGSGGYVSYQPYLKEILNLEGPEVCEITLPVMQ